MGDKEDLEWKKYHLHLYKVVEMFEVDFIALSEERARARALKLMDYPLKWNKPDKEGIVISRLVESIKKPYPER